jgi:hypothetical protein
MCVLRVTHVSLYERMTSAALCSEGMSGRGEEPGHFSIHIYYFWSTQTLRRDLQFMNLICSPKYNLRRQVEKVLLPAVKEIQLCSF